MISPLRSMDAAISGWSTSGTYRGQTVVILGMARQGTAVARFFIRAGARVILSDLRPAEQLADTCAELEAFAVESRASEPLRWVLGGHPLSLLDGADLVCLSGGVPADIPIAKAARERRIPLTSDGGLTLQYCPVPVVGITGSAGKTTTTTLVGLMLEAAGFAVHIGGNIGTPLLDRLATFRPGDKVVMELSSFQLQLMRHSPAIAGITNITPNHLDRHPSMSHYAAAKANILLYQNSGDTVVLNVDDPYTGPWLSSGRCQIPAGEGQDEVYFPLRASRLGFSLVSEVQAGAFLRGDTLIWRRGGYADAPICRIEEVRLRGRHNLANILAAACLAGAAGAEAKAMTEVARTFGGVEHRLEIVRQVGGVTWVNDSIATAPERTVAALRAFSEPIVLLAGGRDKHLPWDECVHTIEERAHHVVLFGEARALIASAIRQHEARQGVPALPIISCDTLDEAVAAASTVATPGDVVLLAPGGTSYDQYRDFAERGQHYRTLVEALS